MQWNMTSEVGRPFYLGLNVLKTAGAVPRPGRMYDLANCVATVCCVHAWMRLGTSDLVWIATGHNSSVGTLKHAVLRAPVHCYIYTINIDGKRTG